MSLYPQYKKFATGVDPTGVTTISDESLGATLALGATLEGRSLISQGLNRLIGLIDLEERTLLPFELTLMSSVGYGFRLLGLGGLLRDEPEVTGGREGKLAEDKGEAPDDAKTDTVSAEQAVVEDEGMDPDF